MKTLNDDGCHIYIGEDALLSLSDLCCAKSQLFILVDDCTLDLCLPYLLTKVAILKKAQVIKICKGEEYKNLNTVSYIIEQLSLAKADRGSVLINLGGGVIGDMGGFAASIYKRGISFIQIPTTLLAMADASVGGKLGVDVLHYKNQIGLFAKPNSICIDPTFLNTLPANELLSGFAEILKMYILFLPLQYEQLIVKNQRKLIFEKEYLYSAVEEKLKIVQLDFKEKGPRKLLNFGHTLGHAFESQFLNSPIPLSHGHAVALGMICELFLSSEILNFCVKKRDELIAFILLHYPYISIEKEDKILILENILQDKKNREGKIFPILIKAIGEGTYDQEVTLAQIEKSLNFYSSLSLSL